MGCQAMPTCTVPAINGYDMGNAGGTVTISGFNPTGVTCAAGYTGTVSYTVCGSAGTAYSVSGCQATCTVPTAAGYDTAGAGGTVTISGFNPTGVKCAAGYTGTVSYTVCGSAGTAYSVSGCQATATAACTVPTAAGYNTAGAGGT